jgi:Acyltransferase family
MGLFFLLAGLFTPAALRAKGPWGFLRDRAVRLGLPLLVYGFVIGPATIALARTARGDAFADTLRGLWQRGTFEAGPLWFAWALLLFALAAAAVFALRDGTADRLPRPWPSDAALLVAALGTGAAAFALRLVWPVGVNVSALQLGYFASYGLLFAFGCAMGAPRWLDDLPPARVQRWRRIAWWALPVLPVLALLGDRVPALAGPAEGGWNLLAVVYAFWEPFVAWGVIGALLWRARAPQPPSPWRERLARRAFAIYVIHPPIVVAVALAWRGVAAPALLKFALTGALACALCYAAAGALLRLPGVRRVL